MAKLGKSQREKDVQKVVSVAAFRDGKLLFGLRGDDGKWNLPGGHLEPGEVLSAGARRELLEETGFEAKGLEEMGFCDLRDGTLRVYCFRCEVEGEPDSSSDPDEEIVEFRWIDPDHCPKAILGNLHNKQDVSLQFLGIQDGDLELIWDEECDRRAWKERRQRLGKGEGEPEVSDPPHKYYHFSTVDQGSVFEARPRIPRHPMEDYDGVPIEDTVTPRVSLGRTLRGSLLHAIKGIEKGTIMGWRPEKGEPLHLYVFEGELPGFYDPADKRMHAIENLKDHWSHIAKLRGMSDREISNVERWRELPGRYQRIVEHRWREHFKGFVPDAHLTGEVWATQPLRLKRERCFYRMEDLQRFLDKLEPAETGLSKGLSSSLLGLAIGAALHGPPASSPQQPQFEEPVRISQQWTPEGLHPELHPIAHLESSFGKFMNHAPHRLGTYHTAHGAVGLKAVTGHEEWKRSRDLKTRYPGLEEPEAFEQAYKSDPRLYNEVASTHWLRLRRLLGSQEKAAYAWRWGLTAARNADESQIAASPYVRSYMSKVQQPLQRSEHPLVKAASAKGWQPAFWNKVSNQIVVSPGWHNIDLLPDGDFTDDWVDGFVDPAGQFFDREQTQARIGMADSFQMRNALTAEDVAPAVADVPWDKKATDEPLAMAQKGWRSKDGITIPAHGTKEREAWENEFLGIIVEHFANGDPKRLKRVTVNTDTVSTSNQPVNKDRLDLYRRMAAKDKLPPVVVRRNGDNYRLVDGNHRRAAAAAAGIPTLDAYEIVPLEAPKKKFKRLVRAEESLEKMAIKDIPVGKQLSNDGPDSEFDYSHVLPQQTQGKYRLSMLTWTSPTGNNAHMTAYVHHGDQQVGVLEGSVYKGSKRIWATIGNVSVDKEHRKQGLGSALYEAFMAHAMHRHGATHIIGDEHSSSARAVHSSLSNKHGMDYKPQVDNTGSGDGGERTDANGLPLPKLGSDYDCAYQGYDYKLKSEPTDALALLQKKQTQEWLEDQLIKTRPGFVFPNLGITDRPQPALISTPSELATKRAAFANENVRYGPTDETGKPLTPPDENDFEDPELVRSRQMRSGLPSGAASVIPGSKLGVARAANLHPLGASGSLATQLHEGFHLIMSQVAAKYGTEGRKNLTENMLRHLKLVDHEAHSALASFVRYRFPSTPGDPFVFAREESLTYLLNYLNSPAERERFHERQLHDPNEARDFGVKMKRAYRHLKNMAETEVTPLWVLPPHLRSKAEWDQLFEKSEGGNLQGELEIPGVALEMLGFSPRMTAIFEAARFLAGGKVLDATEARKALYEQDGDLEAAALRAYKLPEDESGIRALRSVLSISRLGKGEDKLPQGKEIEPATLEGRPAADAIQRAFDAGQVRAIRLNGKHSSGTLLARDPESEISYLLKPGSGESPAAGVEEDSASQSRREAAFWYAAQAFGVEDSIPRADLVLIDGREYAVLRVLPYTYSNLEKKTQNDPGLAPRALAAYRDNGTLHKWAVLDYVFGNVDRHGQNLMIDEDNKTIALIDHGSAFAGREFDPAYDRNSFVPFYLRAWTGRRFNNLPLKEKLSVMPETSELVRKELKSWLDGLHADRLEGVLTRYGIDPAPSVQRLAKLKVLAGTMPVDKAINRLWVTT